MGRTALLALTLAAAAAASPREDAARFEAEAAAQRSAGATLLPLLDGLGRLGASYDWERDPAAAAARRAAARGRVEGLAAGMRARRERVAADLHRYTEEHGLETLERLASSAKTQAPDVLAVARAQNAVQDARALEDRARVALREEQSAWDRFEGRGASRRRRWRVAAGLAAAAAAASLWALRRAVREARARRRGRGRRDVIDVTPEKD